MNSCGMVQDFETINGELRSYSEALAARPQIVAGNKTDIASPEDVERFREYAASKGYEFFPISAASGRGLKELIGVCARKLQELPPVRTYAPEQEPAENFEAPVSREIRITVHEGVYFVEGEWLLKVIGSVNMEDYDSFQYFQRVLRRSGVIDRLEKAGIQEGDTVSIYDVEFDYVR